MQTLRTLALLSLHDPRVAGEAVISMRLPDQALWMSLSLIAVLMTILVSAALQVTPLPEDDLGQIMRNSPLLRSPIAAAIVQWGQAVIFVFVVHWVGQIFGGKGTRGEVLAVLAWMQALSFAAICALLLLGAIVPVLSGFGFLIFICWWGYATVTFIDVAHSLGSWAKSLGVLIASFVGFFVGTSLVLSLVGGLIFGVAGR